MWDVIVVGLGPSGSNAARVASQHGLRVLGVDKEKFPRYKACAAGLTGRAQKLLHLSPSQYLETSIHRIVINLDQLPPIVLECPSAMMVTTRRETLDSALLEQAAAAGTEIYEGFRVKQIHMAEDRIQICSESGIEEARYVIGCDGVHSVARRAIQRHTSSFLPAWEVEYQLPDDADEGIRSEARFDLGVVKRGYGWAFPKRNTISVGVAGQFRNRKEITDAFSSLVERLPGSVRWPIEQRRGHSVPVYNSRNIVSKGRILLAGDAAGLVDPFLGEGIYYALKSGEIAGNWIAAELGGSGMKNDQYSSHVKRVFNADLSIAARLARITYNFPRVLFKMAAKHPEILVEFSESLSGIDGYKGFIQKLPLPWQALFVDLIL